MAISNTEWKQIQNVNGSSIQNLGMWAVHRYVKKMNDHLLFNKVVQARQYTSDNGLYYDLIINAENKNCKAVVFVDDYTDKTDIYLLSFNVMDKPWTYMADAWSTHEKSCCICLAFNK